MRFLFLVLIIALLSAGAEFILPWWSCAVVCFLVAMFAKQIGGWAFLMGFLGVGSFWLVAALLHDVANEHILSTRMAALFKLPNYWLFILVTVFIGGLVGGLAAWVGATLKPKISNPSR